VPSLLAERAHSESARSMRAIKGNLDHSLERMFGTEEEIEPDDCAPATCTIGMCAFDARSG
jgi:hypothetical protein